MALRVIGILHRVARRGIGAGAWRGVYASRWKAEEKNYGCAGPTRGVAYQWHRVMTGHRAKARFTDRASMKRMATTNVYGGTATWRRRRISLHVGV